MEIKLWSSDKAPVNVHVKFLQGMIHRLIVGYYRHEKDKSPPKQHYLKRLKKTIERYEKTKNSEFMMDAANYCMREFEFPSIPGTHFTPEDSYGRRKGDA